MESLEEKIARVVREKVAVLPYDPQWPEMFRREKAFLIHHPEAAKEYARLKQRLSGAYQDDRVKYTEEKTAFIERITGLAFDEYGDQAEDNSRHLLNTIFIDFAQGAEAQSFPASPDFTWRRNHFLCAPAPQAKRARKIFPPFRAAQCC